MGWLKKLFSRDSEPEYEAPVDISIELPKLDSWIEKRLDRSFVEIESEIEGNIDKLKGLGTELKEHLDDLEQEELHNPNIPDREKTLMEGNRVSYIQQHSLFLQQIPYPEDLTYRNSSQFCESFEQSLLKLAKSTGRSHLIMSEFFLKNAKRINATIKQMSDVISHIKEKMQDYDIDLEKNERLSKAVHELQSKVKHLRDLKEELNILDQKIANSKKMREKIEKKVEALKDSDSYNEFRRFDKEKAEHWQTVKSIDQDIHSIFSNINKPLRKFERIAFENADLLKKYIDDPMKALADDGSLKIMAPLSKLRSAVEDDKLSLKDNDKMLLKIDAISREVLEQAQKKYLGSKKSIKEIDDKMRNIRALQELNDLNYKIEHVNNQIQLLEEKIDKKSKAADKIDTAALQKQVTKFVNDTFNVDVTILEATPTENELKQEVENGSDQ